MKVTRDMHTHTNLSACADRTTTLALLAEAAAGLGIDTLGVANHLWDKNVPGASGWYAPQDVEHVLRLREELPTIHAPRILVGCETEYTGNGTLALSPENAGLFEYILVPFTHFHMKNFVIPAELKDPRGIAELMLQRGLEVLEHPTVNCGVPTGFAHPFVPCGCDRWDLIMSSITDEEFESFFKKTAEKRVSVGIHNGMCGEGPVRAEYVRMLGIAKAAGCRFHFESDAHTHRPNESESICAEKYRRMERIAEESGITEDDIWSI